VKELHDPVLTPLDRAVAVMDRLRAPGGCPWDAAQTHTSLVRYLLEECYELVQAIEDDDPVAMREELGDVLLQVLFHARIAAEQNDPALRFDIDEVSTTLVDKLVRRHPHVFGVNGDGAAVEESPVDAEDQQRRWDELKRAEHGRSAALAGVALAAPAVALAGKLGARSVKFGVDVPLPDGDDLAEQIFRLAYELGRRGEDPETAVRAVARGHAAAMAAWEVADR